ncbi:hypothetical protein LguiA_018733 [Lonicera macranthoides]
MLLCFKSNPFFLLLVLPLSLLFSSTFFSFSHGASFHLQHSPISEIVEREFGEMAEWNSRRFTAETSNKTYLILAANRTHREDPLNNFEFYTGGWNITNEHYLFSVGFSAAPPLVVAVIWFVAFGICLFCLCICRCFCRKKHNGYSRKAYCFSLGLLFLSTLAAIGGTTILFIGQEKFQHSIVGIMSYILKEADTVLVNLQDLLNNLLSAKKVGIGPAALPAELQSKIDGISKEINDVASHFRNITTTNSNEIRVLMHPVNVALFSIAITCLVLALLGSLCSILGLQCLVYTLVILGWILVVGTFIMSGVFLLIHNAVADTCLAMGEWLQNPNANSALEELLPKVDNETAQSIFLVTKGITFGIVNVVNGVTSNISNVNMPPEAGPLYYNQSGPLVPLLCNPYNLNLTDRKCSNSEVDFTNASKVWKNHVCEVSANGMCLSQGRLTPDNYTQLTASVNVSYGLYKYSPFIIDLIDSTFIKETFSNINEHNCPSLTKYSEWTYSGFIMSSTALMLSMIIWLIYASQRRRRADTKKSKDKDLSGDLKGSTNKKGGDPFDDDEKGSMNRNSGDHFSDEKGPNVFV